MLKVMNPSVIVILIGILTNISIGYKTNCTNEVSKPCVVFMTPNEDAYQNIFVQLLGPVLRHVHHLGLNPDQTKPKDIVEENEKMEMFLDKSTINKFFEYLFGFGKGYGGRIILVSNINDVKDPSNFKLKTKPTGYWPWKNIFSRNKSGKNIFTKINNLLMHKNHKNLKHAD
uniref:Uncharacterized protein n=1 Tax=Strongyloides venezuelensis TaxID=75913 RepID=A0A0K0FIT5_STRVS